MGSHRKPIRPQSGHQAAVASVVAAVVDAPVLVPVHVCLVLAPVLEGELVKGGDVGA